MKTIAAPAAIRTVRRMPDYSTPPRAHILTAHEVMARYRWGRTKGYQSIARSDFPCAIAGVYRLDTLIAWEEQQLQSPERMPEGQDRQTSTTAPTQRSRTVTRASEAHDQPTALPARRITRGKNKKKEN